MDSPLGAGDGARRALGHALRADGTAAAPTSSGALQVSLVAGRSSVTALSASTPLALLNPQNHGHGAWVYQSSHGGGWVGRDAVALEVQVDAGATLFLSSQAASKAYRGADSRFSLTGSVADGALVSWPEPVTCFRDAALLQTQRLALHPGASLLLVDALTAGRSARGERWAFSRYESRLHITVGDRPVLTDSVLLAPRHGPLAPRLACDATCLVVAVGPAFSGLASAEPGVSQWPWGWVLRCTAPSVESLQQHLRALLQRPVAHHLGDDPVSRRF